MKEIKLASGENEFSISLIDEQTEDLSLEYDVRIQVEVKSDDFIGFTKYWVLSEAMQGFCQSLINLNETRSGSALLESMSSGEHEMRVFVNKTLKGESKTALNIGGPSCGRYYDIREGFCFPEY
ncbi:hypothetical protein [Aliikangiella coralliicola]|uniref:Uncharacterized protein n=1 Tax=Aliikangiella coralliicola TaxID=2592383 RepID=A0A545UGJ9_9GAMM|nr:hypothetical protein [Aliikangiella coralliicola]TQV88587.1 hypothetical protein FLL46_08715 [Aliikangiella coralliicola]